MSTDESTRLDLHTSTLIQESIRHADAKIATMSGVVGGAAVFLAGQLAAFGRLDRAGPTGSYRLLAVAALAAIAAVALGIAAWQLGDGLRPRLGTVESAGRFGLAAQAYGSDLSAPADPAGDLRRLNQTLARIAMIKHGRVRRGLICTAVALAGIVGVVACAGLGAGG